MQRQENSKKLNLLDGKALPEPFKLHEGEFGTSLLWEQSAAFRKFLGQSQTQMVSSWEGLGKNQTLLVSFQMCTQPTFHGQEGD